MASFISMTQKINTASSDLRFAFHSNGEVLSSVRQQHVGVPPAFATKHWSLLEIEKDPYTMYVFLLQVIADWIYVPRLLTIYFYDIQLAGQLSIWITDTFNLK